MKHTEKNEAQAQLKIWLTTGVLECGEVEMVLAEVGSDSKLVNETRQSAYYQETTASHFFSVKNIFLILGGLVLGLGVLTFVVQVWEVLGVFGRVLVTLGMGASFLASALVYRPYGSTAVVGVLYVLGALLMGVGGLVLLDEMGVASPLTVAVWYAIMAALFNGLSLTLRSTVCGFFGIFYSVVSLYAVWFAVLSHLNLASRQVMTSIEFLTISIGVGLLALAYGLQKTFLARLVGLVSFFGINMVLLVMAFKMGDSGVWQLLFFLANLGIIAFVVYLMRTWLLVVGMLYLFYFVIYITAQYFADSLSWPLALILLGAVLMGLGYCSVYVHKRFIKGEK